jgi:hypothetical protein
LPALATARDDKGVRRQAILDAATPATPALAALAAAGPTAPPSVPGMVTAFETDAISTEIDAPAAGVVVLNEMMFPGWRVFVDGQEQPALTVDSCLRGVLVAPGRHRIRWQYTPTNFNVFLGLWAMGLLTVAAGGASALHRRRRRPSSSLMSQPANGSDIS